MSKKRSYRTLLTVNFALSAFVPLIFFGVIAVALLTAELRSDAGARNLMLARSLAAEVDRFLDYPENELHEIAAILNGNYITEDNSLDEYLLSLTEQHIFLDRIQIIDEKGYITHSAPHQLEFVGYNMLRQPFVREAMNIAAVYWSPPFLTVHEGKANVVMTLSLSFDKGIVVAYLNLDLLRAMIKRVDAGGRGRVYMTDQQGKVMAHVDEAVVNQRTNLKQLKIVRLGLAGRETTIAYTHQGQKMIGSVAVVPRTRWTVVVSQYTAEAFGAATKISNLLLAATVFALLISIGLSTWNSKRILKPLLLLGTETRRIARGDYGSSLTAQQPYSELRELANNYASMVDAVRNRETALREERDIARKYLETAGALIMVLDAAGAVMLINDSGCQLLGYSKDDILGRNFFTTCFPETISDEVKAMFNQLGAERVQLTQYNETPIITKENKRKFITWRSRLTYNQNDDLTGAIVSGIDITERRHAEEELRQHRDHLEELVRDRTADLEIAKEQAEAANSAKSDFLARMSHEIRNPMTAVIGFTNMVLKSKLTARQSNYLNKVQFASNMLLAVINDILDFSKVEAGQLELTYAPFELEQVMNRLADLFANRTAQKGLKLKVDLAPRIPRRLVGDVGRVVQVLANLLENAVKFTDRGEIVVSVAVDDRAEPPAGHVVLKFQVSDTGTGIAESALPSLFDPFTQAEGYLTRQHQGTGLGLAICRHLVELMGGRISVQSTPDCGSTFSFTITLKASVKQEAGPLPELSADLPRIESGRTFTEGRLAGRCVLVVEDNELNRQVAVDLLEGVGLRVDMAENGRVAVNKVTSTARGTYDAVFMDMQMPVMDGYEATRRIRDWESGQTGATPKSERDKTSTNHPTPRLPIIALTAHALKGEKEKCVAAGMDDYLAKPIDEQLLDRVLVNWIGSYKDSEEDGFHDTRSGSYEEHQILDAQRALQRLGGRRILYHRLLEKILPDFGHITNDISRLMAAGDTAPAERIVHSLKSTAAGIGAMPLSRAAAAVERAIPEKTANWEETLALLDDELVSVTGAIEAYLTQVENVKMSSPSHQRKPERMDPVDNQALSRMAGLLEAGDMRVVKMWAKVKEALIHCGNGRQVADLDQRIEQLDFAGASSILYQIRQNSLKGNE